MKKVAVLAFNNCLTSSVIGVLDVFEICNNFWKQHNNSQNSFFDLKLFTVNGNSVNSFNSIPINSLNSLDEVSKVDVVIIPPAMSQIDQAIEENKDLIPWFDKMRSQGAVLASICTGIFFLAKAGLLNNKTVTTNPLMASLFHERYPSIKMDLDQVLIDEGDIITTGPTYAFIDLVIYLIEKYCGFDLALQCSKLLLHDKNRSKQTPYLISAIQNRHKDPEIKNIQNWMELNCTRADINIDALADRFHMSSRNFARRFQKVTGNTPLVYLQRMRVEIAKKKLEITHLSIDEITNDVGYSDRKSFGRLFRRYTSLSPSEYRRRFSERQVGAK